MFCMFYYSGPTPRPVLSPRLHLQMANRGKSGKIGENRGKSVENRGKSVENRGKWGKIGENRGKSVENRGKSVENRGKSGRVGIVKMSYRINYPSEKTEQNENNIIIS